MCPKNRDEWVCVQRTEGVSLKNRGSGCVQKTKGEWACPNYPVIGGVYPKDRGGVCVCPKNREVGVCVKKNRGE